MLWRIDDIVALLDVAFLLSKDRRAINAHPVFVVLAIQVAFGVIVLSTGTQSSGVAGGVQRHAGDRRLFPSV